MKTAVVVISIGDNGSECERMVVDSLQGVNLNGNPLKILVRIAASSRGKSLKIL